MANLIIQENGVARTLPALHGEEITIQAPCDCSEVTGVQIADVVYPFYDAAGNVLPSGSGLFKTGNLIRVLIDTVNTRATIINRAVTAANVGALALSGGTLAGPLELPGSKFYESPGAEEQPLQFALDLNNSDVVGLSGLYFSDTSSPPEGLNFFRNATMYDTLYAATGSLYFAPGRTVGESGTSYKVYHEGYRPVPISLGADASLDEVLDPGMHTGTFSGADAATACGAPMYAACYSLLVERTGLWNGNGAKQTFTSHWAGSRTFIRTQVASGSTRVWTEWVEVYTTANNGVYVGSYSGTGGTNTQAINLGFQPKAVVVFIINTNPGIALVNAPYVTDSGTLLEITETGFNASVGYNNQGATCQYVAYK